MLTTEQLNAKYGVANPTGKGYLTMIKLPYPMRLSWDKSKKVTRMKVNKHVKDNFLNVFNELLQHYGYDELVRLEIDVFGGCFNYRLMRGGSKLSRHSWGVAIDLNPEKNGLNTHVSKSQFAGKEYNKMMEIFEKNGFINLGKVILRDTMHFEIAK
jgi:hypothetical protein